MKNLNLRKKDTNSKGITLIALVITIIILLILAGITISTIFGDNGILTKVKDSKQFHDYSSLKEEADMVISARNIKKLSDQDIQTTFKEDLESGISGNKIIEDSGIIGTYYVTRNGQTITVYEDGDIENGKIEVMTNANNESPEFKNENNIWNWYIYTPGQLKFVADYTNNGRNMNDTQKQLVEEAGYNVNDVIMKEETVVYLMRDIDLGARSKNGEWETEENKAKNWIPIGIDNENNKFIATFNGNNHFIKGVYINRQGKFSALFGNSNSILNLTIKDSYIKGTDNCVAGITGAFRNGVLENCHNVNTKIIGLRQSTGGITGQFTGAAITNCTNSGEIYGGEINTAGIAGKISSENAEMIGCINTGNISSNANQIAGLVGYFNTNGRVEDCTNKGDINSYNTNIGGLVGYIKNTSTILNCNNMGNVNGKKYVGGITGCNSKSGKIIGCTNSGNISTYSGGGGIAGLNNESCNEKPTEISECINTGTITGPGGGVGGITGLSSTTTYVSKSVNRGSVKGNNAGVGGIVGYIWSGTIEKCGNYGEISSLNDNVFSSLGGILGDTGAQVSFNVKNCYNAGKILDNTKVTGTKIGGVIAYVAQTGTSGEISHNYSIGEIESLNENNITVGGVIGYAKSSIVKNHNYYLTGKSNKILNSEGEILTEIQMKSHDFVDMLNEEQEILVWEIKSGYNNGYPLIIGGNL